MTRPTLYLIDGSSYLYRAFHALPPLSNRQGEPTGALFGVVNMLRATLKARPDYVAFVADASGPTFRDELYADYKAHRPPTPDELKVQVEPMLQIVEALGFPILRVCGVEADDVIGTLALQGSAAGMDVTISTGDKDLAQLVNPHIRLVNTMSNSVLDEAGVLEKFGVRPDQIVDYLTLVGDSVDNIPGVEKCGPKTAAKWLLEYGALDKIIENANQIGGKIGENLRAALPKLPLSRQLATIKIDVALDVSVHDLGFRERHVEKLRELYTRYEFNSALKELDSSGVSSNSTEKSNSAVSNRALISEISTPNAKRPGNYELVLTQTQFDQWLEKLEKVDLFAFDTETTGLDPMRAEIVGLSFAIESGEAAYVPLAHDYASAPMQLGRENVLAKLKLLLEDPGKSKVGQHFKYDMNLLSRYNIKVQGVRFDTMLESYVWNSTASRHDMDSLAKQYLGVDTIHYEDVAGKGAKQIPFSQVDVQRACDYAAEDADITLQLHQTLWPKLETETKLGWVFEHIEMPLVPVLAQIEQYGVLIDREKLKNQTNELSKKMLELQKLAFHIAGRHFSLDSPKQLQAILYGELGLPVGLKTPTGQPSTNEEALAALADQHELPQLILDYRTLAKLRSTYTEKLPEQINPHTGRVHTSYHQAVAATGRLSSSDPNLQNIPIRTEEGRRIRQAFIAPSGFKILAADYSQIELRILAHLSEDPGLLKAFQEEQDIHRATAAEVFGLKPEEVSANQRRAAKAINFGLIYGMSAFGLARQLHIDRAEAQNYIKIYFDRYPKVQEFMESIRSQAHRTGYVETLFGRRLYLNEIHSRNQNQRMGAERAAINAPMQGTAADIIKLAMLKIDHWLKDKPEDAHMIMQVHDELVFEVREDYIGELTESIRQQMTTAAELLVPLVVDIGCGSNWDEAH